MKRTDTTPLNCSTTPEVVAELTKRIESTGLNFCNTKDLDRLAALLEQHLQEVSRA